MVAFLHSFYNPISMHIARSVPTKITLLQEGEVVEEAEAEAGETEVSTFSHNNYITILATPL